MDSKRNALGRIVVAVAAVAMAGEGWFSLQGQPGPEVTYVSQAYVVAGEASSDGSTEAQPRECDPAKGASSSCIFE